MKLIPSLFKKRLTTQKAVWNKNPLIRRAVLPVLGFLLLTALVSCSSRADRSTAPTFTDYESFVSSYNKKADPISEIYGQYSAEQSSKRVRAKFNLLLDPGKRAYIEILDPSDRLMNVLTLTTTRISLLWAKENTYIDEEATPQNLKAIIGLPVHPDDALQLISGQGLNFSEWQPAGEMNDGWKLTRGTASATILMKENLSRIEARTSQGSFATFYEKYEALSEKSVPTRIRFEIAERRTKLELRIDKYVPRPEPVSADTFQTKLPPNAKRVALNDIYQGKPLLVQ